MSPCKIMKLVVVSRIIGSATKLKIIDNNRSQYVKLMYTIAK